MKTFYRFLVYIIVLILVSNCARTGRPEGGPKDEDAPLFVTSNPPYETINFNKTEIKIKFDEFIKLKDLNKQLVVSPPMKYPPLITPQGTASKEIKIEIIDTLKLNSTYILNFGNAVEDNNESNTLENFKYVFSTGNYIDSLTTLGTVKDAKIIQKPKGVSVLLYRIDSSFNDSIIFKQKPNYVSNNIDSIGFKFTNLRKGNYLLVSLQEGVKDYIFDPKNDKIGFAKDTIQLPRDSIINKPIILFKENQPYKFKRGKEVTRGKIQFGFEGDAKSMKINLLSNAPKDFKSISKFEVEKDTLNYWFTPFEVDSLNFSISNNQFVDTFTVRLRKKKIDSLTMSTTIKGTFHFRDTFYMTSNNPITKIDTSEISLFDKDTLPVDYKTLLSKKENKIGFIFDKKPKQKYLLKFLPNSFTDIYGVKNDTLIYKLNTKKIDDYGRITLNVNNINSKNLIIELLSGRDQDKLVERRFINSSSKLVFDLLEPRKYTIRAIIDENKNNKWDTGNYLKKQLAEIITYNNAINNTELRANYFLEESFIVD